VIADLRQPTATTCGQTCLAMLLGVPVDDVVDAIGGRATTWRELRALWAEGRWHDPLAPNREPLFRRVADGRVLSYAIVSPQPEGSAAGVA
jgi:hypothetical protein